MIEDKGAANINDPEIVLVASALIRPALAAEAAKYVEHADFKDQRLAKIWKSIQDMIEEGRPEDEIDPVSIAKRCADNQVIREQIARYCGELIDRFPKVGSLVVSAQRVHRRATLRFALEGMRNIAEELKDEIGSNDGDMPQLDELLANLAVQVTSRSDKSTNRVDYEEAANEVGRYIESIYNNDTQLYISTGIPKLDKYLGGGLRPGQLHVIHGGTGSGKTALASQIADHAAAHGRRTIMFSMEVDPLDIFVRDVERTAEVSRWDLRDFAKRDSAVAALSEAHAKLLAAPKEKRKIVYGSTTSVEGIRQAVLTERLRGGKVDLVVVDHAQVAKPSPSESKSMPRYLQVKDTAEGLRALARQLKVAVVLTSQLNPPGKGEEVSMNNVRESKDINNPAEVVIVISHVKEEALDGDMIITESWLKVEKARAGQEGRIRIRYNGKIFRFEEVYADKFQYQAPVAGDE